MRLNTKAAPLVTHEGGKAVPITPLQQLRRSVLSCLLWEDEFYEDGRSVAERIRETALHVNPVEIAALAVEARHERHLRHVPLLLLCALAECARGERLVADTIERVISRADELAELCAIYWRDGRKPLSAQMKKGLARSFAKFDAYQFAKYDRDAAVKLADVIRLVRPKPADAARAALYKGVRERSLPAPDTWEVALSGGADKKETFERLLREKKLGYLALLRNLRNMVQADVDLPLVREAIVARRGADRVLPFRFVAAARACPQLEPELDTALCEGIASLPLLAGKTAVLVDVSGSMDAKLSARSDLTRKDAACALASVIHGDLRVFSFANQVIEIPPRRGMAGIDAIASSQSGGTALFDAVETVNGQMRYDRIIVITDEQATDPTRYGHWIQGKASRLPDPLRGAAGYMINVASARNGVGYGPWTHIDGFSENVIRFIHEREQAETA
ncbi:TROVE domain-containing protein [Enterovirga rhinocerotis]|uniref:TROVE domain-containing protein n=1 Tax=Enterovirga rhinocerotis TaxID=1339210 RepID=A0A4R7C7I2_9HYPH|nr:TROVE domain-containing protein [Enterovirga rhinocerotis]TDR94600.1 TROVE domain-containing protein [Enterovirga rhinocerotis]